MRTLRHETGSDDTHFFHSPGVFESGRSRRVTRSDHRIERIRAVLARRQPGLAVVMENIHDPHNVSAVFRTCDAVGVMRVDLLYSLERFPTIGRKSSSSANKWIERRKFRAVEECYRALRGEGFRICATRLASPARSLYDLDLAGKVALVFGNEHRGVSKEAAEQADEIFQIPMMGMIESLNVSVAAAVCLYEALRQRLFSGLYDSPRIGHEDLEKLFVEWIKR